jgi:hypothetical protein
VKKTLLLALVTLGTLAPGHTKAQSSLTDHRSWRCEFPVTTEVDWDGQMLPTVGSGSQDMVFNIDNVDVEERSARFIGNAGSSDLMVSRFATLTQEIGLTFLERTPRGGLNVIVIYPTPSTTPGLGSFKAVTARHPDIFGPYPSQAYGHCMVWE